jgi:Putative lactococcus lactis phage r1t holin
VSTHALRVLDRAARTALQVLAGYLITAHTLGGVQWGTAAGAVLLAVVVALLQGLVDLPTGPGGWVPDAVGRAIRTFAQTALGSVGAAVLITDVPWETVLSASALAAVTSLITSLAATPAGSSSVKGTPELVG